MVEQANKYFNQGLAFQSKRYTKMVKRIYGKLETVDDVVSISQKIRRDVRSAKSQVKLSELHKRQAYISALLYSTSVMEGAKGNIQKMRTEAYKQYTLTANAINSKAKRLQIKKRYDLYWGREG